MKNDISLILMPSWGITDIPLTLSTLSSYLRANGLKVGVFDFNIELYHLLSEYRKWWDLAHGLDSWQKDDFISKLWNDNFPVLESLMDDVIQSNPSYVSFSVFISNRLISERFAEMLKIKSPEIKIVFGGPEIAYLENLPEYVEKHKYVDYLVKGEGEEALLKIAKKMETERIITVQKTISDLDALPFQDFSDFDFEAYHDTSAFPIYSSRGCPNSCIYCTERNFMGRFRTRSAERLFEDIKTQKEKYPFLRMFRLHESTSNGNIKQLEKFCDMMIEADLGLKWAINGAVMRKEMDSHLCKKLHVAGCIMINYGLETPSNKVLENIGKKLSRNTDFDKVVKDTFEAGIQVALNIMFGLPGESEDDFQMQLDFLQRNHKYISIIAPSLWFCYFPKGSEGFENPGKYGINLKFGSLYWSTEDGKNDYLVRLNRFIRYTDLMEELGVQCVFGYPVLPNRRELVNTYYEELVKQGSLRKDEATGLTKEFDRTEVKLVWRENMIRTILKEAIYKIAPYAIHNAINEKARARLLEKRLNKLLKDEISLDRRKIGD